MQGRTVGYMISDYPDSDKNKDYIFDKCVCGQRKRKASKLCMSCAKVGQANEARVVWEEKNVPAMLGRHRRHVAAEKTGAWTIAELQKLCRRGKLPTWEQIKAIQQSTQVVIANSL